MGNIPINTINTRECVCRAVRDAARLLTNAYDRAMAPSGLRTTQFTMLSVLSRHSAASVNQLSEDLGLDQTTTTRNLSVLENEGLVSRVPHHDTRVKLMKLTAKGKQKREKAIVSWLEIQNKITDSVSEEEWKTFQKVLQSIEKTCRELQSCQT